MKNEMTPEIANTGYINMTIAEYARIEFAKAALNGFILTIDRSNYSEICSASFFIADEMLKKGGYVNDHKE